MNESQMNAKWQSLFSQCPFKSVCLPDHSDGILCSNAASLFCNDRNKKEKKINSLVASKKKTKYFLFVMQNETQMNVNLNINEQEILEFESKLRL